MITEDLIIYIQSQLRKNTPHDLIISKLAQAGWHKEDIDEGMKRVLPPVVAAPRVVSTPVTVKEEKLPEVVQPIVVTPSTPVVSSITTPVQSVASLPTGPDAFVVARPPVEAPKVWTPMQPKEAAVPVIQEDAPVISITTPVFFPTTDVVEAVDEEEEKDIPVQDLLPKLVEKPTIVIPSAFIPQKQAPTVPVANPYALSPRPSEVRVTDSIYKTEVPVSQQPVMLSSYAQAYAQATSGSAASPATSSKTSWGKWIVLIVILLALGGGFVAYNKGLIKIPETFHFALVKKDPKDILKGMPAAFSSLSSYATHTKINISSPSFANITSGLVSGEVPSSADKEYVSFDTTGVIGGHKEESPFSYTTTIQSSLIKAPLETKFVYDGSLSYLDIPSLAQLLGSNAPKAQTVSFAKDQSSMMLNELPTTVAPFIAHTNVDALLSNRIAPFINDATIDPFSEFLDKASIIDKGIETLDGSPVYHYVVTSDRVTTKKFLVALGTAYTKDMTDASMLAFTDILGTATFDSFDIWVGQNDMMIHKYGFTASLPLSKVLGLEDKGIAGNEVEIHWETVYSQFNTATVAAAPTESTPVVTFIKELHDMKIKNALSMVGSISKNLKNADGSYGKRVNVTGSCANPNPGSLFSPLGHAKGATIAVGAMASTMNTLLNETNGAGSCFSNPGAWAAAFPFASDSATFICTDSTGSTKQTTTTLTGTVCK